MTAMKVFLSWAARFYPVSSTDVQGAWQYVWGSTPTVQPNWFSKLSGGIVFWAVCCSWHFAQRKLWLMWEMPGEPGQAVRFQRPRPGEQQVVLNILAVLLPSMFCFGCYAFAQPLIRWLVNPIFTAKARWVQIVVTAFMFTMAFCSNHLMTSNWVVWSVGVFTFMSWAFCGRTVATEVVKLPCTGKLCKLKGSELHVLRPHAASALSWPGDDAILVQSSSDQSWLYVGSCGRANLFRPDVLLVLLTAYLWRMPWFILGTGNYNQCPGWAELCMIFYIPFGYPSLATFGFRLALANRWSISAMLVLTVWPFVNLRLGGKGCSTLSELLIGETLPEIWSISAREITFDRGYETCSVKAYDEGGEALLVASTTVAAWVHIMSNYSFLFGFAYGLIGKCTTGWGKDLQADVKMTVGEATALSCNSAARA